MDVYVQAAHMFVSIIAGILVSMCSRGFSKYLLDPKRSLSRYSWRSVAVAEGIYHDYNNSI
jgi:hypothetical protein